MNAVQDPVARVEAAVTVAVGTVGGDAASGINAALKPSAKPEFGDFQLNAAMALGKKLGRPPRDVAAELVDALMAPEHGLGDVIDAPEIAGPGFLNIRLRPTALADALAGMDDEALGIEPETNRTA